ncbi:MAG: hrpB, partial [Verrucomicrobiales bacterium]|nr:hrpB [Verrucomicrobiales bacterium]
MPEILPIYEIENGIIHGLRQSRRLILSAPTGSGKSTQVPQMLLKHGLLERGQAVVLQPRRLPARMLAARVAHELNTPLGQKVGYQIRFENVTSPQTRIRFVTEGILLRQMLQDPKLTGMQALVFDEFHERHLYGDITLARALDVQEKERPDLLIVVMSATLDSDLLEDFMKPCTTLRSEGRMYPVAISYSKSPSYMEQRPVWEVAANAYAEEVRAGHIGDALVFMPGGFEIQQTLQALGNRPETRDHILLPLHGELSSREQDAAVAQYKQTKVVVSTNVAETSLTIPGITMVIDSGLARTSKYDPYRGINTLLIEKISRAAAEQRAGRAGRTAPGICVRLWTEKEHGERPAQEIPEVKRLDLAEVILTIKAFGLENLTTFRWLEPPDAQALRHAEELLTDLGALDSSGSISGIGRKMLAFPLHPRYARMLLAAAEHGCVYHAALIAALTQGRDLLVRNADAGTSSRREDLVGDNPTSDFWVQIKGWEHAAESRFNQDACRRAGVHAQSARQVGPLHDNFLRIAEREGLDTSKKPFNEQALRKCILIGFSDRVARRLDTAGRCELVHGRRGTLARESIVQKSHLLVAAEVREVEGKDKNVNTMLSLATQIEPEWLRQIYGDEITSHLEAYYDPATRRVHAKEESRFRDLSIELRVVEPPPLDDAARLLAQEVIAGRLKLEQWDETVDQWILRVNQLNEWCPELALPTLNEQDKQELIAQLCHGAFTYNQIKDRDVMGEVRGWLSQAQQQLLEKHAPERLNLPSGRHPKVVYVPGGQPYVAARIQEFYGLNATPRIAMGRIPLQLHILAPSHRPVQITQDLAGFWKDHYP